MERASWPFEYKIKNINLKENFYFHSQHNEGHLKLCSYINFIW